MQSKIDILCESENDYIPSESDMRTWIEAALENRGPTSEVSVKIVDESEIRQLNFRYRQRDQVTNVLSFPADLPKGIRTPLLGDIAVCAPVVNREAIEQKKSPSAHWAHILIHGTLHLLGFDHIDDREAEQMERIEREILARMNFPAPY